MIGTIGFMLFIISFSGIFEIRNDISIKIQLMSSPRKLSAQKSETMKSINAQGIYPGGEGAGYAGGIMSAAVDGIKIAEKIIEKFNAANGAEE